MELSKFSAKVRVIVGAALMGLAYSPVIFDFCQSGNSGCLEICRENISQKSREVVPFTAFQLAKDEESLCNELLKSSINYASQLPVRVKNFQEPVESSKRISNLKKVSKGVYAGATIVKSKISSNFYSDARRLGVPAKVVDSVIRNLSSKIDFRRSLKKGNEFEIIFDNKKGLLYSKILTKKRSAAVYMIKDGAKSEYFFEDGFKVSVPKSRNTFGQPLLGKLQVSSKFGNRFHPVRKTYKFHTGVDLKANYGAPVKAICDGEVVRASYHAGYGRCVDIKHSSGYMSRYAHLSKCDTKVGARVKKGTVIGRVGSSGVSTGPHLHLELAKNHKYINPLSIKMIPEAPARVKNMKAFNATKSYVKHLMAIAEQ